jgi:mitochondrial distribution and morphology protein 10
MDYIVRAYADSTDWNHDNSYSSLTATSDALLAFETPSNLSLNVSSLSTSNFATSYTLSTLGQIDGSISYLYTNHQLGSIPAQSPNIPLRSLVRGYRDLRVPSIVHHIDWDGKKPTLLHATLALPPPSTLTALYARRIRPDTLLSLFLYSKSLTTPTVNSSPPPASVLAHVQHDTGQFSIEGLASTDSALLGARGMWNFGLSKPKAQASTPLENPLDAVDGSPDLLLPPVSIPAPRDELMAYCNRLASKPSLLSAGGEFYYSPFSHVIGMSTGLRFTTLASHTRTSTPFAGTSLLTPANIAHSSFPYTMTLTLNPLVGSIASTYSVKPTPNLALSSRCDFNFYSWESRYVLGAEVWRGRSKREDTVAWAREKLDNWFTPEEKALKDARVAGEEENVLKFRVDDSWNFKALWTGRVKALLVSAGVSVSPITNRAASIPEGDSIKRWTGSVGVSVAYST